MKKRFNDAGLCIKEKHYMVDISPVVNEIFETLIEYEEYFTIDKSRQYGKSTIINSLVKFLEEKKDYFVIETSFEGIGNDIFDNQDEFCEYILDIIIENLEYQEENYVNKIYKYKNKTNNFIKLSKLITKFVRELGKEVVFIIDEIDNASNYKLFLNFLGMLRDKYLRREKNKDYTFSSIILIGINDIKTIKQHIISESNHYFNSPWNIAVDFKLDLSFIPEEIVTMLNDYTFENKNISMQKEEIAEKIYYYTSGYPWLVSKLCKFIDEDIIIQRKNKNWSVNDVITAYKMITAPTYRTTLLDNVLKNLQGYTELNDFVKLIVIDGYSSNYNAYNSVISFGTMYSILREENGKCIIHNRIFKQRFYDYFTTGEEIKKALNKASDNRNFYGNNDI